MTAKHATVTINRAPALTLWEAMVAEAEEQGEPTAHVFPPGE